MNAVSKLPGTPAPLLSMRDIQLEVERIFNKQHRSKLTAIYGSGEAGKVTAAGTEFEVVPTRCEMELRARLPVPGESESEGRVFLVDWTQRPLPLDLACRLAAGRLYHISSEAQLAALFGARLADPELMGTGLAKVLLAKEVAELRKVSGLRVSQAEAYRRFLDAHLGFGLALPLHASAIVSWGLENEDRAHLLHRKQGDENWHLLRQEIRIFVRREANVLAELAWRAWEGSQVRRFLELVALIEAHQNLRDPVAEGLLQGQVENLAPSFGLELLGSAELLQKEGVLEALFDPSGEQVVDLLRTADGLILLPSFLPTRQASLWLETGHRAREGALAEAFAGVAAKPGAEAFARLRSRLESLEGHHLDSRLLTSEQRDTRRMAVRLAAYVCQRAETPPRSAVGLAYQPAVDLAKAHVAEGGFVDWCRSSLRTTLPFDERLTKAIHAILDTADELRLQDDEHFAHALIAWLEAGRPALEMTPIDRVTRQFVGELLCGDARRRVLIVLVDGMSWASAVQILTRLESEKWAPILWRPRGHAAQRHLPPVIADLPTLTQVSRAAFFAGRRDRKAGDKASAEDRNRWAANRALLQANDEAALPGLVLRGQLMEGESLSESVRKAIDSEARVVGVVVNALDEDHRGSTQTTRDYSRDIIKPLSGLLTAAAGSERIVLLASDHGHVMGDAMRTHSRPLGEKKAEGKRWRILRDGDTPHPFELELPADTWRPRGAQRVAAIWDETISHGRPAYGEHGGLSLAEVVAPSILIAPEWLAQVQGEDDSSLETHRFQPPTWWELELPLARQSPAAAAEPSQAGQLSLLQEDKPAPTPSSTPAAMSKDSEDPLVGRLQRSKIFRLHVEGQRPKQVAQVLEWLGILLAAGGSLNDRELARRCRTRPHQVAGLVARMGLLNVDGYAIVEHDLAARQVTCHRQRLIEQFALEP